MKYRYPKTFPNPEEERFLNMLFSRDHEFINHYHEWITQNDFNTTPIAISRLLPLVYARLKAMNISQDTDPITHKIKGIYKLAWYKNQLVLNNLSYVLKLLNQASVHSVLLKGTALLAETYLTGSPSASTAINARFQNDIDILIPKESVRTVIELFKKDGWHFTDPNFIISEQFSDERLFASTKEVTFSKPGFADVDFHWHITASKSEPCFTEHVWNHARSVAFLHPDFAHVSCKLPSHEDLILHSIVHGAYQNDARPIRWIPDVLGIIQKTAKREHTETGSLYTAINWNTITETALSCGFEVELYFAVHYLCEQFPEILSRDACDVVSQITITPKAVRTYFSKTDTLHVPLLGNLPELWEGYKKSGSDQTIFEYFATHWNLDHPKKIPGFIFKKIFGRLVNALKRLGFFISLSK